MKLLTKFNIVLIIFFGAGGFIIARLAYDFLMQNACDQVLQQAELMMAGSSPPLRSARRNFTASVRCEMMWRTLHTSPMPPAPRWLITS